MRVYGKLALPLFEAYFLRRVELDPEWREKVLALRGRRLGCFCLGKPPERKGECHGLIIAAWVDEHGCHGERL